MDISRYLEEYKPLRAKSQKICNRLIELIGNDIGVAAKTLGRLNKDGRHIDLDTEDELALLAEYAIYDIFHDGENLIDQMLASEPPAPGSDEMLILQAMKRARYTVLKVTEVQPGVGLMVGDLLGEGEMPLMDVGLSKTVLAGAGLAARIYSPLGTWWMTTGTGLPIEPEAGKKVYDMVLSRGGLSHLKRGDLSAIIIRACLAAGASHKIAYTEMGQMPAGWPSGNTRAQPKVGRNEPCPCGSGKKYKKCCGSSS